MSLQLASALAINETGNLTAYNIKVCRDFSVDQMQDYFAHLNGFGNIEWLLKSLDS